MWPENRGGIMTVFLGGTCGGSEWRDIFLNDEISKKLGIEYFDPVVKDWNEEAQKKEIFERENSDFCLYVITPLMTGVYSIAEVIDDSNKRPEKTLFCFIDTDITYNNIEFSPEVIEDMEDVLKIKVDTENLKTTTHTFNEFQIKSLKQVGNMVKKNGGQYFEHINDVFKFLNNKAILS